MDDGRASRDDEKDFTSMKEKIHQVHVLGKRANSGFKREAWHAARTKLNSDHAVSYTKEQIVKTSGIGFEAATCRFICLDGSWAHFLRDKPTRWSLWQTKREFASTSTAPTSPNRDGDLESDDGDDIVGKVQDFLASENEGSESTDGSVAVGHSNVDRKRTVQTPSAKAKRIRLTLSSSMVDEIRGFRESGREELNVVRGMLAMDVERPTVEALAIDLLHEAFDDDILLEEELSFAYEVLECKAKAAQSVRMKDMREKSGCVDRLP
ncbi:hypothetical protein H257_19401 [Aphanomyces astaci]|uniref:Myb/SANT-like domain-containing protein n=1 Tax=Aphanomyces astaci TaxID=112090 RepID=W4F887_APHAT|nr:hypothetical protein H257_19401 [Aphanomyces astaci]ETV63667.1 hypothetical protein H257_19401 [Aphanomyces astaci]|eukprot:XP_009846850.1 hypothetical protein H257_19401 [Aphanomyces astaci]